MLPIDQNRHLLNNYDKLGFFSSCPQNCSHCFTFRWKKSLCLIFCIFFLLAGSYEQSPCLLDEDGAWPEPQSAATEVVVDDRLKETLADAMLESPTKESSGSSRHGKQDL